MFAFIECIIFLRYVFVRNIYFLVLLQTICKWVMGIVNEEVDLPYGNEILFHLLEENVEEKIVSIDNMAT